MENSLNRTLGVRTLSGAVLARMRPLFTNRPQLLLAATVLAGIVSCGGCNLPFSSRPPEQAAFGPGGSDYKHAAVGVTRLGEGAEEVWLFWPEEPTPQQAPLVVFMHGWSALSPKPYSAWIAHLVRKGNIVIYPRYQESVFTAFEEMEPNAIVGLRAAWEALVSNGPVQPDPTTVAWIAHSLGGILTVNLASASVDIGLPPPGAMMIVQPGGDDRIAVTSEPGLPPAAFVLVVTGDRDHRVGSGPALRIVNTLMKVLAIDRLSFVTIPSDWHSFPPVIADHFACLAESPTLDGALDGIAEGGTELADFSGGSSAALSDPADSLDYYGYWKLADGLIDLTFHGIHGDFVMGDTTAERFMGVHSDGVPAVRLVVHDLPESTQ